MADNMRYFMPVFSGDEDYKAFRGLIGEDLTDTYDEWLQLHEHNATNLIKNGHDVRYVEMYPSEFISFCSASERKCNLEALEDFALKKGLGPD
jgi:hypothetical protein